MITSLAQHISQLEQLADLPAELAVQEAVLVLEHWMKTSLLLNAQILLLSEQAEESKDFYVAQRYDDPGGTYSLQVFVWPPGSQTQIHDHSCWGVFCCAVGAVLEERYARLDDGARPNQARLRKAWQREWRKGQGTSALLPYAGGIHRVANPSDSKAISVHLYGPLRDLDGRDYDPSRDYVCDRRVS